MEKIPKTYRIMYSKKAFVLGVEEEIKVITVFNETPRHKLSSVSKELGWEVLNERIELLEAENLKNEEVASINNQDD